MKNYDFKLIYKTYNKNAHIANTILTFALIFILSLFLLLYFLGFRAFAVNGWSAEPYHHYGSLAIDYKVPFNELKVGDFVTWTRSGSSYVTHQIISIDAENQTVVTCQQPAFDPDTNNDGNIRYDQIQGKVLFSISEVGFLLMGIKGLVFNNSYGFGLNIIGIMFIVSLFVFYSFFRNFLEGNSIVFQGGTYDKKK